MIWAPRSSQQCLLRHISNPLQSSYPIASLSLCFNLHSEPWAAACTNLMSLCWIDGARILILRRANHKRSRAPNSRTQSSGSPPDQCSTRVCQTSSRSRSQQRLSVFKLVEYPWVCPDWTGPQECYTASCISSLRACKQNTLWTRSMARLLLRFWTSWTVSHPEVVHQIQSIYRGDAWQRQSLQAFPACTKYPMCFYFGAQ